MNQKVRELLDFLTIPGAQDCMPQIVIADKKTKVALKWMPGKKVTGCSFELHPDKYLLGFTGKYYRTYQTSTREQTPTVHWLGVDIDLPSRDKWMETYKKLLGAVLDVGSIRSSTRGNGFHVIFRLSRPMVKVNRANILATLRTYTDAIVKAGVEICTVGVNMYLLGGLQQWLYVTPNRIDPVEDTQPVPYQDVTIPTDLSLNQDGQELAKLLATVGVPLNGNKTDIYIKDVYNALQDTPYEFETKSPMQSVDHHINGFICYDNLFLYIYAAADQKIVAKYYVFN